MAALDLFSRRQARLEAGLPHGLRLLASELEVGIPFEEALGSAARGSSVFSGEMARVCREARAGSGIHDALLRASARTGSLQAKRAYAALARCYSGEDGPSSLKSLATEYSRLGRARLKEHASRASMLGIAFISASCVLPSLFLAFAVLGSSFMGEIVSPETLWLSFGALLPAVLLAIILLAWLSAPAAQSSGGPGFLSRGERERVRAFVSSKGIRLSGASLLLAFPACAASALAAFAALGPSPLLAALAGASILLSPLALYALLAHFSGGRARRAERFLPDALLHASSLAGCASFEEAVASISRGGYGPLGEEFAAASRRMQAGEAFPAAMEGVGARLGSEAVCRACGLLSRAYETGADLGEAMREAADDAVELFSSGREKAALLATQRYTLLAGAALVPVILGLVCGAVTGISASFEEAGGSPFDSGAGQGLVSEGLRASTLYLAMFAVASSLFLGVQEGEPKKAAAYAFAFLPLSLAIFSLALGRLPP
ncbi:MAG: type II secretion system F family protein [Candidatus ainarchaeum sp.]|nr:type II secretion system F family protein [Candidatus ainarchaeum sp.]